MRKEFKKEMARIESVLGRDTGERDSIEEYSEPWMNKKVKSQKTGRMVKIGSLEPAERAKYRPKSEQKPAHHHAAEALRKSGHHKLADKVMRDPKSHAKIADKMEDINNHGIAAMLRADDDTDVEVLAKGEHDHHEFDMRGKPEKYGHERDDALRAKYEATNPDKRMGDGDEFDKWQAPGHLSALRYLHKNNLHHTDTYKRLADKVNKHKDKYKKLHDEHLKGYKDNHKQAKAELKETQKRFKDKYDRKYTMGDHKSYLHSIKSTHDTQKDLGRVLGLDK